jgi:hypothetical protein
MASDPVGWLREQVTWWLDYARKGAARRPITPMRSHEMRGLVARCEAELALLAVHVPAAGTHPPECEVCAIWEDSGEEFTEGVPVLWPCLTLAIVAAGHRNDAGYAEHWNPQPCPACGLPEVVLPLGHALAVPLDGGAPSCSVLPPPSPGIIAEWLAGGTA